MKRLLVLMLAWTFWMPLAAQAAPIQVLPDRFIIAFHDDIPVAEWEGLIGKIGGRVLKKLDLFRMVLASPVEISVSEFESLAANHPAVLAIENDFVTKWIEAEPVLNAWPDENLQDMVRQIQEEWHPLVLKDGPVRQEEGEVQWGVQRVNAPAAWPTNQGKDIKVAIIDTGIDPNHPELAANIAGGYNAIDNDQPWADDHFHGTHVAGIVAALLNGRGVVGIAPQAKLYAVKVLTKEGSGSLFGILDGMMWCAENGMQIANMSLGAEQGNVLFENAVQTMVQYGVTLVAAAGNSGGSVGYPAAYKEAIAVSALDKSDMIASFSSRGPEVDFIAPGVKIPSTITGGGTQAYSGTSMATPHVAGLAALAVASGSVGPDAVRKALEAAATPLPGLSLNEQGKGLVDAARLSIVKTASIAD